ncbi:glutamate receptor 2.8-like [Raphanus sativus]|uniref:Glutamate receptor n=1 Tax=Raphanus sativus TaxID=3726 RepID=A0A6J0LS69_RAPSA|nr:glutamate receptor 2.8-like [Raphanus sativus]
MMTNNTTNIKNTFFSYFVLFLWGFAVMDVGLGQNTTLDEIKIGVVLDLKTNFSKICLTSINMSLSDFYQTHPHYRTRLALHVRDSMKDIVEASDAAYDLIKKEQVRAIIGPRSSMQAEFMIKLANKFQVPTISFSATSPLLKSIDNPYFVRATIDDSFQAKAIAAIVKSFGWRSVVAVYVDNELGEGIMHSLSDALEDVRVQRSVISPEARDDQILTELYKLMTKQTRVFVMHMASDLGFRVLKKAREIGMMEEGYVWLLSNGMTRMMRHNGRSLETMQGLLGVRSLVPQSKELEDFRKRWKRKFEPNVFALWAYDSVTALAMAVEKTNTKAYMRRTYGQHLLESLSSVEFKGLAGEFKLINRQLESSTFEIINVIGDEERIIGIWTPTSGLVNAKSNETTSFLGKRFGPVIWPGNSTAVPKGWEFPTCGKKIKVGVPVNKGFLNFVEIKTDPISNVTTATGYAIDIFEAALKKLPYPVIPQYYGCKSSYNDLVYQVYEGKWDVVVGDITIIANRSSYVDFTLPYTESGVSMIVPLRDNKNKNAWVFLKPWSLDLWITTVCFFILIGFVVWLFEHRVNTDFRGPPHHQIGTSVCFSFSTMVFAHREKVVSNLARFVVVVWCFVVLVLTQSYTANLTSFLTVQSLQPTTTNVKDLISNGESVGYHAGTFVRDFLRDLNFPESQLKSFGSAEECDDLLSKGTSKGGIAAAFDEVPYLKDVVSQYCPKYAMVEPLFKTAGFKPSFKTAGFGFAFPKNSPMIGDVSRAILKVTQSKEMSLIENKWFNRLGLASDCPGQDTADLSSNRLSVSSFWGLFLIAGVASFLALLVFVALFLYEHRHTLCSNSEGSIWRKLKSLFRIFDEKDIKSHTFKSSAVHNVSSPITPCTPSPSNVQIRPLPRCMSLNREFELRRACFSMSEERFRTQPKQDKQGGSDIEFGAERQREVKQTP